MTGPWWAGLKDSPEFLAGIAAARGERNILDYGVTTGTAASQTIAIKTALDANPGAAFYFPPGDYRLDTTLSVTSNNPLRLASGARIYAGAAMSTLIDWDNGAVSASNYAQDKFLTGNGTLDAALNANTALAIGSVIRFTLGEGLTIIDPINRGIVTKSAGAEIIGCNIRLYNTGTSNSGYQASVTTTSGSANITAAGGTFSASDVGSPITGTGIPVGTTILSYTSSSAVTLSATATASGTVTAAVITNIAIEANMGDCQFSDIITRDFTCGLWDKGGGNVWTDFHPWIGTTAQLTVRYPISVGFLLASSAILTRPYADTYRYAWRTAAPSGGYSRIRVTDARHYVNTGNLTSGIATANLGALFDLQDGSLVQMTGGRLAGGATAYSFLQGSTIRFNARNFIDEVPGSISGLNEYRRGVPMGTFSFAASVFGSTAGSATLSTNQTTVEIRDGYAMYRFVLVGTLPVGWSGKMRIGIPTAGWPTGATAVSTGVGSVSFVTGPDINVMIGANASTPGQQVVLLEKISGGVTTEPDTTALANTAFQVWGYITCPFTYPS